ncbi:MAG: class I SAM-dependent methyltransferase [Candidatus Aminicenantales bacterium]
MKDWTAGRGFSVRYNMSQKSEKFIHTDRCPICFSPWLRHYKKGTFNFNHLHKEQVKITDREYGKIWDLDECQECGHVFANPSPAPDFIFALYQEIEDPSYEEEAEGRSRNFLRILRQLEKFQPSKGILFDVGAATGILLHLARRNGWRTDGIEASAWAARLASKKYQLHFRQGFFEQTELESGSCQAVTMIDYIEHTPKPREAVAKAIQILSPGGILCLVTPDIHSAAARITGRKWWHCRPAHLAYFSLQSLSRLLEGTGFMILKKRKYAWTFSAHYLLSRKNIFNFITRNPRTASFLRAIPIKLALGDSFEIYAQKDSCS